MPSCAIRANVRIDIFWLRIFVIRPNCHRFAQTTARTLVFPGINGQFVAFKMVIGTGKIMATAFGTIADDLTVAGHSSSSEQLILNCAATAADVWMSMDPALGKSVERRFFGRCPKYDLLDSNC